ncbi:MAG: protoporphyrinogen oxidase HemJ [Gammaproteobacteria bacterium]|nr:protoporphyrinogen oxidase HemJ [Gammaproteobacteria bacterium]
MLWLVAFHVIFVVCWFAGLFYLPRLFVYHAMSHDQISIERFKIMERKLFWGIMTPSAILSLLSGIWLLVAYAWQAYHQQWWLDIKLFFVLLLLIYHGYCYRYLIAFKHNNNQHSDKFYRWFNEVPVLFLCVIIVMVVVKPF